MQTIPESFFFFYSLSFPVSVHFSQKKKSKAARQIRENEANENSEGNISFSVAISDFWQMVPKVMRPVSTNLITALIR